MSVLIEHDGPILRITLNRPEVRNAIDEGVIHALTSAAAAAAEVADFLRGTRAALGDQ